MASIITATTTSGLTQSADNSGVLQLASGTGNLVTIPSVTGTAMVSGNMPAFSAYGSTTQNITNSTWTKVVLNNEEFDTASCFDSTTNYRFTPNVAGYYQISGTINFAATTVFPNNSALSIYKNGAAWKNASTSVSSGTQSGSFVTASAIIYFNGTTDYVELYGWMAGANGGQFVNGQTITYLTGALVRGA